MNPNNDEVKHPSKKRRTDSGNVEDGSKPGPSSKSGNKASVKVPARCKFCRQLLSEVRLHSDHPEEAVEECIALTDAKLSLLGIEQGVINDENDGAQTRVTNFSVYDEAGHLCPFDEGLIEQNVQLKFSGFLKPLCEEDPGIEGGVAAKDMGPINEWWVSGYDGGEKTAAGFSTAYGEYYVMKPSEEYAEFMKTVEEKLYMVRLTVELLSEDLMATYEDLVNKIQKAAPLFDRRLTEEDLIYHAKYVCEHVLGLDPVCKVYEAPIISCPCLRALVQLTGIVFKKRKLLSPEEMEGCKSLNLNWNIITKTPLISKVLETLSDEEMNKDYFQLRLRQKRCEDCDPCEWCHCQSCIRCAQNTAEGRKTCGKRRCLNMSILEAEENEKEEETYIENDNASSHIVSPREIAFNPDFDLKATKWQGKPFRKDEDRSYYRQVEINAEILEIGDFVTVNPRGADGTLNFIARVEYMWQDRFKGKHFHACWFCRSEDTMLGRPLIQPQELFVAGECEDVYLASIVTKVNVTQVSIPNNWAELGGAPLNELEVNTGPIDSKTFFFSKMYDRLSGRFEDIPANHKPSGEVRCFCCERKKLKEQREMPTLSGKLVEKGPNTKTKYGSITWRGQVYRQGTFVFLSPGIFDFKSTKVSNSKKDTKKQKVDEELYPESYRKTLDNSKSFNASSPPFCIGYIMEICTGSQAQSKNIFLRVKKMYRPENTFVDLRSTDLNEIYWSEEEEEVSFSSVLGQCYVIYQNNLEKSITMQEWMNSGPDRFFFVKTFDKNKNCFLDPSPDATLIGSKSKIEKQDQEKASGTSKIGEEEIPVPKSYPKLSKPLRCMDVFAGCGGLTQGLFSSGLAETCWAIEKDESAAQAFQLNHPKTTVFTDDVNSLLNQVISGRHANEKGQVLPKKGEVDLICGGPPSQRLTGKDPFNSLIYSYFKNSLIVSYLTLCDYYRPRFCILESFGNFVSFKNNMVLKMTILCLLRMGYQCTFRVLQAGNYGVPQNGRRTIILAAAPGEVLPDFPEPTHSFSRSAIQHYIQINNKRGVKMLFSKSRWIDSAPLRTITLRDAISDLPAITNGAFKEEMDYGGEAESHFQRQIRGSQHLPLLDHICKRMSPLVEARISHIPTTAGSDWRDLPNIVMELSDGTHTKKLQYTHHSKQNGKGPKRALRGVCICATEKKLCDPMDRQSNTLIPWCLTHTGNKHDHWAGLYGRLQWDGVFSTNITNPEPMGKQGKIVHPDQNRVVSVRECARSQGFPDSYKFYGDIVEKHRQIGQAVPPPMAKAIGFEIIKSVLEKET